MKNLATRFIFSACTLFLLISSTSFVIADDPGGMSEMLLPQEDIEIRDQSSEKWFIFHAEEDGVLIVLTHDSNKDLVIEIYPEEWRDGQIGRVDRDIGHSGNEMLAVNVERGKDYYVKVLPLDTDSRLPRQFKVMSAFVPEGNLQRPFLSSGIDSHVPEHVCSISGIH